MQFNKKALFWIKISMLKGYTGQAKAVARIFKEESEQAKFSVLDPINYATVQSTLGYCVYGMV